MDTVNHQLTQMFQEQEFGGLMKPAVKTIGK